MCQVEAHFIPFGDVGEMEARFGPFGDSIDFDA
jgi:hypothetical protein